MGYKCPKCGYERQSGDLAPEYECPKCGVIYAKAEKAEQQKSESKFDSKAKPPEQTKVKVSIKEKLLNIKNKLLKSVSYAKRLWFSSLPVFKKHKTISITALCFVLIISGIGFYSYRAISLKNRYISTLYNTEERICEEANTCVLICELYKKAWREAIESPYNDDFNDDIREVHDQLTASRMLESINNAKERIHSDFKRIQGMKKYYPDAQKKITELYGLYSQLNSLANSPSGSLMSFSKKINNLESEITRLSNEFSLLMPEEPK